MLPGALISVALAWLLKAPAATLTPMFPVAPAPTPSALAVEDPVAVKVCEFVTVCVCVASTFSLNVLLLLLDDIESLDALLFVVLVLPDMRMLCEALLFELDALLDDDELEFAVAAESAWLAAASEDSEALALALLAEFALFADELLSSWLLEAASFAELDDAALLADLLLLALLSADLLLFELSLADRLEPLLLSPELWRPLELFSDELLLPLP